MNMLPPGRQEKRWQAERIETTVSFDKKEGRTR
jgi:hypothetical protein